MAYPAKDDIVSLLNLLNAQGWRAFATADIEAGPQHVTTNEQAAANITRNAMSRRPARMVEGHEVQHLRHVFIRSSAAPVEPPRFLDPDWPAAAIIYKLDGSMAHAQCHRPDIDALIAQHIIQGGTE
jgi:hypothetical protein